MGLNDTCKRKIIEVWDGSLKTHAEKIKTCVSNENGPSQPTSVRRHNFFGMQLEIIGAIEKRLVTDYVENTQV